MGEKVNGPQARIQDSTRANTRWGVEFLSLKRGSLEAVYRKFIGKIMQDSVVANSRYGMEFLSLKGGSTGAVYWNSSGWDAWFYCGKGTLRAEFPV